MATISRLLQITGLFMQNTVSFDRALLQKRPTFLGSLLTFGYPLSVFNKNSTLKRYRGMGWLQLVGSIKLQVSFAKETYKRDAILQKLYSEKISW